MLIIKPASGKFSKRVAAQNILYNIESTGKPIIIKNQTRLTWKVKFDDNFNERR